MRHLDRTDARILLALDDDPLATTVAVAERLDLARNTVQARHRRLEADGSLAPPSVRVRPARVGYPALAFVTLEIDQHDVERTVEELSAIPEVCEMHATSGDGDLVVRVVATDTADLHRVTRLMVQCPGVARSSTAIAMLEVVPLRMAPLLGRCAL